MVNIHENVRKNANNSQRKNNESLYIHLCIIAVHANKKGVELSKNSILNISQMSVLETEFTNNPYPTKTTIMQVAQQTGLLEQRVRRWFANKRLQARREKIIPTILFSEYTCNQYTCRTCENIMYASH